MKARVPASKEISWLTEAAARPGRPAVRAPEVTKPRQLRENLHGKPCPREIKPLASSVRQSIMVQVVAFVVVLLFWWLPVFNPIKLLVVLLHELSHVVAAYLTGGVVFGIAIDPGSAGATLGVGGHELTIVAAGYCGSLLIGLALYLISPSWDGRETWAVLAALACVSLGFGWLNTFTAFFGYTTLGAMLVCLFFLSEEALRLGARVVATASCLYPIIDVLGDALPVSGEGFKLQGRAIGSDVAQLARLTGWDENWIVAGWLLTGVVLLGTVINWAAQQDAVIETRVSLLRRIRRKPDFVPFDPMRPSAGPEYTIR